jgi:hypothetical protein
MSSCRRAIACVAVSIWIGLAGGCAAPDERGETAGPGTPAVQRRYFASPEAAVPVISNLLSSRDWATLASYYDVPAGSPLLAELKSGRAFLRADRPSSPQAAGLEEYRPFAPGSKFVEAVPAADPSVVKVTVAREFEAGGGMKQRALRTFSMRRTAGGYQLLPAADEAVGSPGK